MQAPRRLQLRRGNTAAISTYVGAPGELIVDTTTNTLYLHNGVTVGGTATTVNTASITSNISSLQGNITTLTANAGVQASNIASLTSSITGANAAIVTANTSMKGYVDSVANNTSYSNANVATYLTNYDGDINFTSSVAIISNVDVITVLDSIRSPSYQYSNGVSILSGLGYGNTEVASYLPTYTGNIGNVKTTANVITSGYFVGNGALLTGIVAGTTYSNSNVASYLPTYSGNIANLTVTNTLTLTATKIALGYLSGLGGAGQGTNSVAVGSYSGYNTQGNSAVAIGVNAGMTQGDDTVAIGSNAGGSQTTQAVAVGFGAGQNTQSMGAVALGYASGQTAQGLRAVAIGSVAGNDHQGAQSIAIGHNSGYSYQPANSIELNATGTALDYTALTAGLYITSVKNDTANVTNVMYYNTTSKEVTYGPASGGSNYSNTNVAAYLTTATITTTGNITAGNLTTGGALYVANITTTGASGNISGANYITANVILTNGGYGNISNVANLQANTVLVSGNITATYFLGNGALLTGIVAGGSSYSNVQVETYLPTYAGTVSASLVNTSGNILSSGLSVFGNTRIGLAGAVSGQFHTVVGNITQTSSGGAVYINTTGNVLAAAVVAGAVTSTGTVAVNAATGITTNQATFLFANATATTINMGGAATTINLGTTASATGNVFVGGQIGSNAYNLTLRANGRYNVATSIDSNGGFNSPPYANQLVIGGTGTGMTANYSATGGYLTTLTIYNSGTGYRNGDVISVPGGIAGNSFVLQNYSPSRVGAFTGTALYTFGIDGNLTLPGNVITSSSGYFMGNAGGTTAAYTGNVSAANFIGSGALLTALPGYAYSNVNVASYLSTATINTTGNITAQNLIGNISITGNVTGTSANVTLQAGAYTSVFDNQGNVRLPTAYVTGNVTANYFVGNGALLTGIAASSTYSNVQVATYLPTYSGVVGASNVFVSGNVTAQYFLGNGALLTGIASSYSNVQVATYLPTYTGNIANVRLSSSGVLTFPDGTQQTTAAFGGGGNYGNANVAAFLPTYTGTTGITAVGTLATLSVTGNTTVGNLVGTEANTRIIANVYTTTFDIYGNVSFPGNIITPTRLYVGPTLFTALPNTIAQFTGNANSYAQINFENLSSGTDATADYVATANNGTDTTFFVDLGIANSNYDNTSPNNSLGTAVFANDSYLYAQGNLATTTGGNLVIGTSTANKSVKIFAGGINSANIVATVSNTGVAVTGNVSATNYVGSGSLLSGVATKITGSWTVPTGNSTQSFTIPDQGAYQLWVIGNIPNGIISYNATATITNSNVPVVGQQFAWVYNGGGTPIDFTSIPNQFTGTGNTIVRSTGGPSATTNRFDFGINNTSGGNVTVTYGYVKIS